MKDDICSELLPYRGSMPYNWPKSKKIMKKEFIFIFEIVKSSVGYQHVQFQLWDPVTVHLLATFPSGWRWYLFCFLSDTNVFGCGKVAEFKLLFLEHIVKFSSQLHKELLMCGVLFLVLNSALSVILMGCTGSVWLTGLGSI